MQTFLFIISWLLFIISWLLLGFATAHFAKQRGRDPIVWFCIGTFFGILGLLFLFILSPLKSEEETPGETAEIFEGPPSTQLPHHDYAIKDWYYYDDNKERIGPISFEKLKTLWASAAIRMDSYLWSEGMDDWKMLKDIPELEHHLAQ